MGRRKKLGTTASTFFGRCLFSFHLIFLGTLFDKSQMSVGNLMKSQVGASEKGKQSEGRSELTRFFFGILLQDPGSPSNDP